MEGRDAWLDGERLELTVLEFDLLSILIQHPGKVFSRADLLDKVWDNPLSVTERTVDSLLKRMRVKLGSAAHQLETVRGVGYRFKEVGR